MVQNENAKDVCLQAALPILSFTLYRLEGTVGFVKKVHMYGIK
jgi:hypothetical protein